MLTHRELDLVELFWHGSRVGICPPTLAVRSFGELAPRLLSGDLAQAAGAVRAGRGLERPGVSLRVEGGAAVLVAPSHPEPVVVELAAFQRFTRRYCRVWIDEAREAEVSPPPWFAGLEALVEDWERA